MGPAVAARRLVALLPNFLELNEIWLLTYSLTFAYTTGAYIFGNLMPSVSEAYSHGMRILTQRYIDQGLRWGLMITCMLGVAYVAMSPVLIGGLLPPQFGRALAVMGLMHLFRLFDFFTRMPDQVFMGAGRTGTFTWTVTVEHLGRILFTFLFIKWFGFYGLFYAFALSAALKIVLVWPLMARLVVAPVFSFWQTFVNPALSALGTYFVMAMVVKLLWHGPGHLGNTWMVIMACLVGAFPVYLFISGLLGWDASELLEFHDAVGLVPPPFRSLAELGYRVVQGATAISPLHERFPAKLSEGVEEAAILTATKAKAA